MSYKGWRNFRHIHFSESSISFMASLENAWSLEDSGLLAQFVLSQDSLSSWETYLAVDKKCPCPSLLWESLCCLCQRRHTLKSGTFFPAFSILFDHWQNTLEARVLQNKNSHRGKGAKYCGDLTKHISRRTSFPDERYGKSICSASPVA